MHPTIREWGVVSYVLLNWTQTIRSSMMYFVAPQTNFPITRLHLVLWELFLHSFSSLNSILCCARNVFVFTAHIPVFSRLCVGMLCDGSYSAIFSFLSLFNYKCPPLNPNKADVVIFMELSIPLFIFLSCTTWHLSCHKQ